MCVGVISGWCDVCGVISDGVMCVGVISGWCDVCGGDQWMV